eukprot:gene12975-biopygen6910
MIWCSLARDWGWGPAGRRGADPPLSRFALLIARPVWVLLCGEWVGPAAWRNGSDGAPTLAVPLSWGALARCPAQQGLLRAGVRSLGDRA